MKSKITLGARLLLGLMFFAGGIVGLFNLAPPPADLPERMQSFNNGLMASGYFMPFLKGTETICGLLLLSGMFVPLALVVLAPIILNIFLLNAFLMPEGIILAVVIAGLETYLAFFAEPYANVVKGLFRRK